MNIFPLIQTPLSLERLLYPLRLGELEGAGLLGDGGALLLGSQTGHQFGHQSAGLLGVEVAGLLGDVHQGVHLLVVTLLRSLLGHAALATDLHWLLLTLGIPNKLAVALVHIPGGARRLVHCPALLGSLAVTNLLQRPVTLPDCLLDRLLLECDLAALLKVLITGLLLGWLEIGEVSVVTLFHVFVFALQDGIFGQGLHRLLLDHTQPAVRGAGSLAEVHSTCDRIGP